MKKDELDNLRHSCAHLLAAAVMELWPDTKRTIGPAIETGFYYDFQFAEHISEQDLPKIEKKMWEILPSWKEFEREEVTVQQAKDEYKGNQFKIELINEFSQKDEKLTFYTSGDYSDLCRGGHIEHPYRQLKHFKLLSIAGAYWRGDEKNPMLTRIYGTCFPTEEELEKYLWQQEEAKKRDHRKLGEELDLFVIDEKVGKGLVLWLPKGTIVKEELEKWAKDTEQKWGYMRVSTPNITKSDLFYTSGHLPYYKKDMYPPMILDEKEEYYLKPMNCPHHHRIYASRPKSYRDLPLRLAEYGTCYRYESSGELYGLMRVRGFTQNDAHIYCTKEQAVDEFVKVMELHEYYYRTLGIKEYHLELSLRDPNNKTKYHGDEKMWQLAEQLMRESVKKTHIPMVEQIGNAAFYGPKIDFVIHSVTGREFAASTNQIDLFMGDRFKLKYIDSNGKEKTPVIIHRAPLGSHERFIGFLIEHYAGKFPVWLSPVQVILIPISQRHIEYVLKMKTMMEQCNLRVEVDDRNESMQSKIRTHTLQKIPYLGIIGDKEMASGENPKITIRTREGKNLPTVILSEFIDQVVKEIDKKH